MLLNAKIFSIRTNLYQELFSPTLFVQTIFLIFFYSPVHVSCFLFVPLGSQQHFLICMVQHLAVKPPWAFSMTASFIKTRVITGVGDCPRKGRHDVCCRTSPVREQEQKVEWVRRLHPAWAWEHGLRLNYWRLPDFISSYGVQRSQHVLSVCAIMYSVGGQGIDLSENSPTSWRM